MTTSGINVRRTRGGDWEITATGALTDRQAAAITWRADLSDVVLGDFVSVRDDGGVRIGHLHSATFYRNRDGMGAICTLELM